VLSLIEYFIKITQLCASNQIYNIVLPFGCARVRMQMTTKGNVVLYLDKELVEKSKELGFNLSKTFENHLKHLINGNSPVSTQNNCNLTIQNSKWWTGPDSDRRPSARQADVLTRLDDRSTHLHCFLRRFPI
jgi:hypothetical protein